MQIIKFFLSNAFFTIIIVLLWLSGTNSGRTQQTACTVLEEMCQCGSGDIGCDKASLEEINVLLDALQSPHQAVRDAALRVSRHQKRDRKYRALLLFFLSIAMI